jgi:hypothetical protein
MSLAEFPGFVKEHWPRVRERIEVGTYIPLPVRRKVNEKKSRVARMSECGFLFLGFTVRQGKIRWTAKAEGEFKRRIRSITRRRRGVSMAQRFQELTEYMRMDGLLPFVGVLPALAGTGSLDSSKNSGLPLETVAQNPNASAGADEARHPIGPPGLKRYINPLVRFYTALQKIHVRFNVVNLQI